MKFWKLVFAVIVAFFILRSCGFFTPSVTPAESQDTKQVDLDQIIYNACSRDLPGAVTVESPAVQGDPTRYTIDLDEFILCGDYVTDFKMGDLTALTTITSTSDFTVVTPDGRILKSPLVSSYTNTVEDAPGQYHLVIYETYAIEGLTGYSRVEMPSCGAAIVGVPGALTVYRCDSD